MMDKSLSDEDIIKKVKYPINLITYDQIPSYKNIDELFGNKIGCVILYQRTENYGHWTAILQHKNYREFFDSYGKNATPDTELSYSYHNKKLRHPLASLIEADLKDKNWNYNNYTFQKLGENINTCGRWVADRLNNYNLNIDEYVCKIYSNCYKLNLDPDLYISQNAEV